MEDPSYPSGSESVDDDRLTEVEIKVTHQEHLLETLNQVVIEQQKEIEAMRLRLDRFERMLSNFDENPANERPPHY